MARNARKNKIKFEKKLAREKKERETKLKLDTEHYEEVENKHSINVKQSQTESSKQSSRNNAIDEDSSDENKTKRKPDCIKEERMKVNDTLASINKGKGKRISNLQGPATSNTESHRKRQSDEPSSSSEKKNKIGDEYNSETIKDHTSRKCTQRENVVCREISQSRKSDRHNSSYNRNYVSHSDDQSYIQGADKKSWRADKYKENSSESSNGRYWKDENMEIEDISYKINERSRKQTNNYKIPAVDMERRQKSKYDSNGNDQLHLKSGEKFGRTNRYDKDPSEGIHRQRKNDDHSSHRNNKSPRNDQYFYSSHGKNEFDYRGQNPASRRHNDDYQHHRNHWSHLGNRSYKRYDENDYRNRPEKQFENGSRSMYPFFDSKNKKNKQRLFVPKADYYEPTIREVEGDLFEANEEYSLAHCVAEDFMMGAGIAKRFKKEFNGVQELLNQGKKIGEVAILYRKNRFIFYLVTKTRSQGKPTYESITKAIQSLKKHCLEFNVVKLAIPRIGCGLDRLDWDNVKDILYQEFHSTDIEIVVYVL